MQPSEFVERMMALWKKPNETLNVAIAAVEYRDSLAKPRFTPEQMAAGWEHLRETHDRTAWPLISECLKAIRLAPANANRAPKRTYGTPEYPDFANAALRSDLARRAKQEGWLLGLWDHCNITNRMPSGTEVGRLRDSAERANQAAMTLDRRDGLQRVVASVWDAMRERERSLCRLVAEAA